MLRTRPFSKDREYEGNTAYERVNKHQSLPPTAGIFEIRSHHSSDSGLQDWEPADPNHSRRIKPSLSAIPEYRTIATRHTIKDSCRWQRAIRRHCLYKYYQYYCVFQIQKEPKHIPIPISYKVVHSIFWTHWPSVSNAAYISWRTGGTAESRKASTRFCLLKSCCANPTW